jgi:hypothetical protein
MIKMGINLRARHYLPFEVVRMGYGEEMGIQVHPEDGLEDVGGGDINGRFTAEVAPSKGKLNF